MSEKDGGGGSFFKSLASDSITSVMTYFGIKDLLKGKAEEKLKGTDPQEDEKNWGLILEACRKHDTEKKREEAENRQESSGVDGAKPTNDEQQSSLAVDRTNLHYFASMLPQQMMIGQRAFFIKIMDLMLRDNAKKDDQTDEEKRMKRCVEYLEDLRVQFTEGEGTERAPNFKMAIEYLENNRQAVKTTWDQIFDLGLVKQAREIFNNLTWDAFNEKIKNFPKNIQNIQEFLDALEGMTQKLGEHTERRAAERRAEVAEESAAPFLQRKMVLFSALVVGIGLVLSGIFSLSVRVPAWESVDHPHHYSSNLPDGMVDTPSVVATGPTAGERTLYAIIITIGVALIIYAATTILARKRTGRKGSAGRFVLEPGADPVAAPPGGVSVNLEGPGDHVVVVNKANGDGSGQKTTVTIS